MLIVYMCHMHGCVLGAETDEFYKRRWCCRSGKNKIRFGWDFLLCLRVNSVLWSRLTEILNDFGNHFFANFYSNVILKRKRIVLTRKSTGKYLVLYIFMIVTYFAGVSGGHVMKLKAGEKVWIQNIGAVASLHSHHTTFTGFRIGEYYKY